MGMTRSGRIGDRPFTMLVFVAVAVMLVYLWAPGWRHKNGNKDMDVQSSDSGRRYAIVSMQTKETSYDHIAMSTMFGYAKKHDYDMRFHFEFSSLGTWDKYTFMVQAIESKKYDWIFWMDYDAMITNSSITLDSIVDDALAEVSNPDQIDMILTPDCFPLNIGVMLFRATPWIAKVLEKVFECGETEAEPGRHLSDQDCLRDIIKDNVLQAKDKSVIIRQWKMNAFPPEIGCYDDGKTHWEKGMFIVHFAGAWAHVKDTDDPTGDMMRKYYPYAV